MIRVRWLTLPPENPVPPPVQRMLLRRGLDLLKAHCRAGGLRRRLQRRVSEVEETLTGVQVPTLLLFYYCSYS